MGGMWVVRCRCLRANVDERVSVFFRRDIIVLAFRDTAQQQDVNVNGHGRDQVNCAQRRLLIASFVSRLGVTERSNLKLETNPSQPPQHRETRVVPLSTVYSNSKSSFPSFVCPLLPIEP